MELFRKNYEFWTQKLISKISTVTDKLNVTEEEQASLDKIEIDFNVDLKHKNEI